MAGANQYRVIGKRAPKVGGMTMVRGEASYTADLQLPGLLYGRILRSPFAHARIRRLDASRAQALEGVKAVIAGSDFPDASQATFPLGDSDVELEGFAKVVMARDKVLFHGHPVAAVAATDPWTAEEALNLIQVEYEVLEPVLDVLEAMKSNAPLIDPQQYTKDKADRVISEGPSNTAKQNDMGRGDLEKGFAQAEVIVDKTYRIEAAHQGYLEPPSAIARAEPDGQVTVWSGSQGSFSTKAQTAGMLNIPLSKLRLIPMEVGGAFGGKIFAILEPVAALLALRAGRPVRVTMSREEVLRATGPGAAAVIRVRSGCRRDGTITAIDCCMVFDEGCLPEGGGTSEFAMGTGTAPYGKVPNLRIQAYDVITNKPPVHPYRAPGAPQAAFAVEQNIDAMAKAIGMDPLEFRLINSSEEGDPRPNNIPFNRIGLREMLQLMKSHPHWNAPLEGSNRGRGLALGYWLGAQLTSSALVSINTEGSASVVVGSIDLTGTRTTMQQVAAEVLGLNLQDVQVTVADTETVGFSDITGGSRITYTMSAAVRQACLDALAQLRRRAASRFNVTEQDLEYRLGRFTVKSTPQKTATLRDLAVASQDAVVGKGSISDLKVAPAFSGHIADVEVDPETGKVRILRYTAFQDVGLAVNPTQVEAQIQGGGLQGIGWGLHEQYCYDDQAKLLNATLLDYRQPVAKDVPMLDTAYVEVPASDGPYGVRGVGEAPIVPAAATLANAIESAIGLRLTHMPMTPERVFWAIHSEEIEQTPSDWRSPA